MSSVTENVTLGSGTLYLNGIDVGHLKGVVQLTIARETVDFKPANMTGAVKKFVIRENCQLKATLAEIKSANFRLAMGHSAAVLNSIPSYALALQSNTSVAGSSYDAIPFGGHKTCVGVPLEFVHQRANNKHVSVIFYAAVSQGSLDVPFDEENVNLYDVTWLALSDEDRTAGDQIGCLIEETDIAS